MQFSDTDLDLSQILRHRDEQVHKGGSKMVSEKNYNNPGY